MPRWAWLAMLALLPAVAPAVAEEAAVPPLTPQRVAIAADKNVTIPLAPPEGGFRAGGILVFNGQLENGTKVHAELQQRLPNGTAEKVARYAIAPDSPTRFLAGLAANGTYQLLLQNIDRLAPTTMVFYVDVACACPAKPIPVDVERGWVLFEVPGVEQGATWSAAIPEPRAYDLNVTLVRRVNETSAWPRDFVRLASSNGTTVHDRGPGPVHEFDWTADVAGTYYVLVQGTRLDPAQVDASDPSSLRVEPSFTLVRGPPQPASPPGPATPAGMLAPAALALAAVLARRLR